ncbi:MAG: DNA repair protein RecN [Bacteroidota bacterium]
MLQQLSIRNYAIIDELEIRFHPQFNIITGETGAGKSILMGALGLVLGNRADSSVLYDAGAKCVVEATFALTGNETIMNLLAENELDEDVLLVVRREIAANGKSRSFINDTPVTLQVLRQFSSKLVDLHQQFDTLEVGEDDFQRNVIDSLANHALLIKSFQQHFSQYSKAAKELQRLKEQQQNAKKEFDYLSFLLEELQEANFEEDEIENLEAELKLLSNAENIKLVLAAVSFTLKESEQPIVAQIKSLVQQLHALRTNHAGLETISERMQAAHIELKDIADEVELLNDRVNMDAARMQQITDRIDLGNRLLKKHSVLATNELIEIKNKLQVQLQQVINIEESIAVNEKSVKEYLNLATGEADIISTNRKAVLKEFESKVALLLKQVGMPNALLRVNFEKQTALNIYGSDIIQFLFDANKSGRFEPLQKVASGGELSRLMLSIKSIVARSMQMPTLIFDEIDTGISGEAARQVGVIMKDLAQHHQLIAITHQPQIAALATAHYFVFKKEQEGRIKTRVRLLNDGERVDTIARMLSGENISESVLATAREMVDRKN